MALTRLVYCTSVRGAWGGPEKYSLMLSPKSRLLLNRASHDGHLVVSPISPGHYRLDGYDGPIDKRASYVRAICIGRSLQLKDPFRRQATQTRGARTVSSSSEG